MLMQSKFDSYCKRCGKPLFKGDLIEYSTDKKKAFCVVCRDKDDKIDDCKHMAVKKYSYKFTSSNRYKYSSSSRNRSICCLICGKPTTIDKRKTMYIQTITQHEHGHSSYKGFSIDSYIQHGENEVEPPDLESLTYLYEIIANNNIDDNIKNYAENHIIRICDNLNIENKINLYKKESFIKESLTHHQSIYDKSLLHLVHRKEMIKRDVHNLSKGWNLNSDIGLVLLDVYNWVVLEQSSVFKSNISEFICGLEMYAIYNLWVNNDKNIRGKIQYFHDDYINDSILIKEILIELNLILDIDEDYEFKENIINMFRYACKSYFINNNFEFGIIKPDYNEEHVARLYSKYFNEI